MSDSLAVSDLLAQTQPRRERRYAGLSDEERRAGRRRRLIEAGLELFGAAGYAATSIERLCQRAGVTTRHFYEEFAGREALLMAVFDESIARSVAAVHEALYAAGAEPAARARAGVEAYVRAMADDVRRLRVVYLEVVGVSATMEEHRHATVDVFARITAGEAEAMVARGALPRREYGLTAIALAGATNGLLIAWMLREPRPPVEAIVDELARLFVAAMGAP